MPQVPPVPRGVDLAAAVEAVFAPGGALASALDGFEARPAQIEMAAAVADVLADGGILLAEAGTGTGKTLAYLVPAILSRQRVLVSTGTKNLQEQIYFKDLPRPAETLGVPFTATYMKGRAQLSLPASIRQSLEGRRRRSSTRDHRRWRSADHRRAGRGRPRPAIAPRWTTCRRICRSGTRSPATSENCLGTECPRYGDCFVTQMRQRAAESDVVIVNHHLLCADAAVRQSAFGEVIPACQYAIVDEAHQLEDVATQYFGVAVSNYRFDEFARDVEPRDLDEPGARRRAGRCARRATSSTCATRRALFFGRAADAALRRAAGRGRARAEPRDARAGCASPLKTLDPPPRRPPRWSARSRRSRPTVALAEDVPEDVIALGTRAAELRDDLRFLTARRRSRSRLLPGDPRARRLPARVADRRVGDRSARCCSIA